MTVYVSLVQGVPPSRLQLRGSIGTSLALAAATAPDAPDDSPPKAKPQRLPSTAEVCKIHKIGHLNMMCTAGIGSLLVIEITYADLLLFTSALCVNGAFCKLVALQDPDEMEALWKGLKVEAVPPASSPAESAASAAPNNNMQRPAARGRFLHAWQRSRSLPALRLHRTGGEERT